MSNDEDSESLALQLVAIRAELRELKNCVQGHILANGCRRDEDGYLVRLVEVAALVQRSKRSLEWYLRHPVHPLPDPEIRATGGKPHFYRWAEIKPWAERVFGRRLPEIPPSSRREFF